MGFENMRRRVERPFRHSFPPPPLIFNVDVSVEKKTTFPQMFYKSMIWKTII